MGVSGAYRFLAVYRGVCRAATSGVILFGSGDPPPGIIHESVAVCDSLLNRIKLRPSYLFHRAPEAPSKLTPTHSAGSALGYWVHE